VLLGNGPELWALMQFAKASEAIMQIKIFLFMCQTYFMDMDCQRLTKKSPSAILKIQKTILMVWPSIHEKPQL